MTTARRKHRREQIRVARSYPERTCLGCMKRERKSAMVRLAAGANGQIEADFNGRMEGRGAYLHPRRECLAGFAKSRVREFRSLRRGIDRAERVRIAQTIEARLDSNSTLK